MNREMATTVQQCRRCGSYAVVSLHAQTGYCSVCNSPIHLQRPNYGHPVPTNPINNLLYTPFPSAPRPFSIPSAYGRKRALLVGVTYYGQKNSLNTSLNDVMIMKAFLLQRMGFPNASILVLTEYERDPYRIPTKQNIRTAMRWLVQDCQSGDSLVFYYKGHASQVPDEDMDEIDGYDEALWPLDYQTEGRILDDEINATIVRPLTYGAKLHAIIDTGSCGTVLDLPYMCRVNPNGHFMWEDHQINPYSAYKGTSGGTAICFSACDDDANCRESMVFADKPLSIMTYSFIRAFDAEANPTYGQILNAIRSKTREATKMLPHASSQEPQLSSSQKFRIYSDTLIL